jgi:hypothetical protein
MILTGKAKKDFGLWHFERNTPIEEYKNFYDLSNTCKNALIIEWFDSVGIYINIENLYYQSWWYYKVKQCPDTYEQVIMQNTRQEATEEAIKKTNEIYNKI